MSLGMPAILAFGNFQRGDVLMIPHVPATGQAEKQPFMFLYMIPIFRSHVFSNSEVQGVLRHCR